VKILFEKKKDIDLNFNGRDSLFIIAESDEITNFLLNKGVNINTRDYDERTALIFHSYGNLDRVKFLLEKKDIDVNLFDNEGNTALIEACQIEPSNYDYEWMDFDDIKKYKNVEGDEYYFSEKHFSEIMKKKEQIVKLLLENKDIDVNIQNKEGDTALMKICKKKKI
jgi:ankyrin repeat protein